MTLIFFFSKSIEIFCFGFQLNWNRELFSLWKSFKCLCIFWIFFILYYFTLFSLTCYHIIALHCIILYHNHNHIIIIIFFFFFSSLTIMLYDLVLPPRWYRVSTQSLSLLDGLRLNAHTYIYLWALFFKGEIWLRWDKRGRILKETHFSLLLKKRILDLFYFV